MEFNIWRLYPLLLPWITVMQKCTGQKALLTIIDDRCITNSSSAMAMLYNTNSVKKNFQTEVSQIRHPKKDGSSIRDICVENEECFTGRTWLTVNSLEQGNVYNLITDRRWEAFRTFVTKHPLNIDDALDYQHAAFFSPRTNDLQISFSVQAEMEAHVFLCDGSIVSRSNCYWFLLQAWKGTESGFRQCKANEIQHFHDGGAPKGICNSSTRKKKHDKEFPLFLSDASWKNFRIVIRGDAYELQDHNGLVLLVGKIKNHRVSPKYLFFHTKTGTGLWKVHNFDYFYTDTAGDNLKSKRPFTLSKGEHCLTMFVAMCESCSMKIDLVTDEEEETILLKSSPIKTEDQRWTKVKYIFTVAESHNNVLLRIATLIESPYQRNNYWAVSDVRLCDVDEIRDIKSTNRNAWTQRCQLVGSEMMAGIQITKDISSLERNCTENQFGEDCLDCELIYGGACPKKNKYCQLLDTQSGYKRNCYCSIGYREENCKESCRLKTYGHGCRNSCGNCQDGCSNDLIFGKCDTEFCFNNFLGEKCDIPSGIFIFDDLPEIEAGATSCNLSIKSFKGTGNQNEPQRFYKFQYAKIKDNETKNWKDVDKPLQFGVPKKVTIPNLDIDSVYAVRVFGFEKDKDLDSLNLVSDKIKFRLFRPQCNEITEAQIQIKPDKFLAKIYFDIREKDEKSVCDLSKYSFTLDKTSIKKTNGEYTLHNLEPNREYNVAVIKNNNKMFTKTFRTLESVPGKVENFNVKDLETSSELSLTWSEPTKTNGALLYYDISYQLKKYLACERTTEQEKTNITLTSNHNGWRISDLKPYAKYSIGIRANTSAGFGTSTTIAVETNPDESVQAEEIPQLRSIPGIDKVAFKFSGVPCEAVRGPLYVDTTVTGKEPGCNDITKVRNEQDLLKTDELIIAKLKPFCKYDATLKLYRKQGKIVKEMKEDFKTLEGVPNEIRQLEVTSKGTTYISLRWLPPDPPTGQLDSYKISYCSVNNWKRCNENRDYVVENSTHCKLWPDFHCVTLKANYQNGNKFYTVKVQAKNKGNDDYSGVVEKAKIAADDKGRSQPPYNVDMKWTTENYLFVSWYHPNETAGVLTSFMVYITGDVSEAVKHEYKIGSEKDYFLVYNTTIKSNLTFPDKYKIEIAACNLAGESEEKATISGKSPPPIPEESIDSAIKNEKNIKVTFQDMKLYKKSFDRFLHVLITECGICDDHLYKYENNLLKYYKASDSEKPTPKQWKEIKLCDMGKNECAKELNIGANSTNFQYPIERNKNYRIGCIWINKLGHYVRANSTIMSVDTAIIKIEETSVMGKVLPFIGIFAVLLILVPIYIGFRKRIHTLFACTKTTSNDSAEYGNIYPAVARRPLPPKVGNSINRVDNSINRRSINRLSRIMPETICPGDPLFKTKNTRRIQLKSFQQYVKHAHESNELDRQHKSFPRGPTKSCTYGSLEQNRAKNRYKDLIAYNHSRVVLNKIDGDEYSDYINASYIDGYKNSRAYIATQGPKSKTVEDFWRMIWQEKVKNIVVLANVIEGNKKKMEQYWPNCGEKLVFGDFTITFLNSDVHANYEYRKLQLHYQYSKPRLIGQLHFKAWPDHGVPLYPQSLVPILKKMILWHDFPIVVHCSAGVGRTGTVILCDICLRMVAAEGSVDVLAMLEHVRNQRTNMVDNSEQYKLAHLVILNCLREPGTSIPISEDFATKINELFQTNQIASQVQYIRDCEWEDEAMKPVSFMDDEEMPMVPEKNRFSHIIPDEAARVYLHPYPVTDPSPSSTYINAVKVDAFCEPERFIVTQFPLPNTVGDFWRLVADKDISVIICLNDIPTKDKSCELFFPIKHDKMSPEETIQITHVSNKNFQVYTVMTYHMTVFNSYEKTATRTVEIIKFRGWKMSQQVPADYTDFLTFVEDSTNIARKSTPTLITCYDGATASGLFIAMSFLMEKIKLEHECDVCQAIRSIRTSRKQFVSSEEQLEFLYKASIAYVEDKFNQYANI